VGAGAGGVRAVAAPVIAYRPDVDGLRAAAVIPVVLYHAGLPGFSGGFVGVDVFFVISGYLITAIVAGEVQRGQFSIGQFYERRVRRIFPALFFMLAAVMVAAWFLFLAGDFEDLGRSAAATTVFASNFYFWQQAGYFEASSELRPLLHVWSLAVEEQFYIVLPLVLLAVYRVSPASHGAASARNAHRNVVAVLALAFALSLLVSEWAVRHEPSAAYYLTPARAWELLLGALLALRAVPPIPAGVWRELAAGAGLLLMACSVVFYSEATAFPGFHALLPCLGAALVLHAAPGTCAGKWLALRPVVAIGLLSYSLYLWHWPLFVFARYLNVFPLTLVQSLAVVLLAVGLAWLSWKYVESPFRTRAVGGQRGTLFAMALAAASLLVAAGLAVHWQAGVPARLPAAVNALEAGAGSRSAYHRKCLSLGGNRVAPVDACEVGAEGAPPAWALWGDSHASSLAEAFGDVLATHQTSLLLLANAGCPPVLGIVSANIESHCPQYTQAALAEIERRDLRKIILVARFAPPVEGFSTALGPAEKGKSLRLLNNPAGTITSDDERRAYYLQQFNLTVKRLTDAGRQVVLVYPVPETGYDIPSTLARLQWRSETAVSFNRPLADYLRRQAFAFTMLDNALGLPGVTAIYPQDVLCDADVCRTAAQGRTLYVDDNHLSLEGARLVADRFATALSAQASRSPDVSSPSPAP
jgi:peptidoglycan/LPS O-acetylase OafA/YrhL